MPRLATASRIGGAGDLGEEEAALAAFQRRPELHVGAGGRLRTPDASRHSPSESRRTGPEPGVSKRVSSTAVGVTDSGPSGSAAAIERHHLRIEHFAQAALRRLAKQHVEQEHGEPEEHHQHDEHRQQEPAAERWTRQPAFAPARLTRPGCAPCRCEQWRSGSRVRAGFRWDAAFRRDRACGAGGR